MHPPYNSLALTSSCTSRTEPKVGAPFSDFGQGCRDLSAWKQRCFSTPTYIFIQLNTAIMTPPAHSKLTGVCGRCRRKRRFCWAGWQHEWARRASSLRSAGAPGEPLQLRRALCQMCRKHKCTVQYFGQRWVESVSHSIKYVIFILPRYLARYLAYTSR